MSIETQTPPTEQYADLVYAIRDLSTPRLWVTTLAVETDLDIPSETDYIIGVQVTMGLGGYGAHDKSAVAALRHEVELLVLASHAAVTVTVE